MDFIVWLIELLIKSLEGRGASGRTTAPPPQTRNPLPSRSTGAGSVRPSAPISSSATPPAFDGGDALRVLLTVIGVVVLIAIVTAWFLYIQGWL